MEPIAYVGIDYHINVLAIAVVVKERKGFYETVRLSNNDNIIKRYMKKLSKQFKIKACYEASSSGYAFQRKMASWGSNAGTGHWASECARSIRYCKAEASCPRESSSVKRPKTVSLSFAAWFVSTPLFAGADTTIRSANRGVPRRTVSFSEL